uniref:Disintegrin domain-containing protein n=1 Tax=Romanomermis culicivorax TaxID=13658 RepID=A0A915L700_ROMCU
MNTFSVSGYDENNKRFSPCSLRSVKAVLQSKSDMCFEEEQIAFCGNKRVEIGEDCDEDIFGDEIEGTFPAKNHTTCCTNRCKFQPGAVCSPKNSPCCTKTCEFAVTSRICRQHNTESCRKEAYCTGECRNGVCLTFCEKSGIDMRPCICEN